jgi:hypothetical protein
MVRNKKYSNTTALQLCFRICLRKTEGKQAGLQLEGALLMLISWEKTNVIREKK